jgi:hypothetical protein
MNKEYLKWLRELAQDTYFQRFGKDFRSHRQDFLNGETPGFSAWMLLPW